MQTFLPYSNFDMSARVLDNKRLGKQRVEAYQILNCLKQPNRWKNHPAVKMWKGHEEALMLYINCMILEWKQRGFKNTMQTYIVKNPTLPYWLGNEQLHASHRSNLLRKNPVHYSTFNWKEPSSLNYYWPVK